MSSDLYLYGKLSFPKDTIQQWESAKLPVVPESDDEMGVTFEGASEYKTVEEALAGADDVYRFLIIEAQDDEVLIRGALGDDDWYPWTTTLGAMARAATALGATGQIEVLDDGSYIGKLVIKNKAARFDSKAKQTDKAGEKDLLDRLDLWLAQEETKRTKKKPATKKPAAKKSSTKKVASKKTTAKR